MNVNETIYNMLLQKLETAKITQRLETSREGTRYTVLDPARLPLKPIKPNKFKVILVGIFLGVAIGGGLAFSREFMDQSFLDVEDAKLSLGLPILGAISRITTPEEIEKERNRKKIVLISGSAFSITLLIITILISLLKK
jgi:capsular polysaccharide biosynthesis protein